MKYTLYQITNLIDGKVYVGCHKTDDIDDGYMGSGKYLKRAIEKHGIENFQKDILGVFDTPEEMFYMESVLVNEDFVKNPDTYNLKIGGNGGWSYLNVPHNISQKSDAGKIGGARVRELIKTDRVFRERHAKMVTEIMVKNHKDGKIKYDTFTGKNHSDETKRKIGEANSIHQKGSGNSQYGTMWITNEVESKKIRKDEEIPEGWRKGRKISTSDYGGHEVSPRTNVVYGRTLTMSTRTNQRRNRVGGVGSSPTQVRGKL